MPASIFKPHYWISQQCRVTQYFLAVLTKEAMKFGHLLKVKSKHYRVAVNPTGFYQAVYDARKQQTNSFKFYG